MIEKTKLYGIDIKKQEEKTAMKNIPLSSFFLWHSRLCYKTVDEQCIDISVGAFISELAFDETVTPVRYIRFVVEI